MSKSRPGQGHAWADFLYHRMRAIAWMHGDGRSNEYIAHSINVDPVQLQLLLMTIADDPKKYPEEEPRRG